MNFLRTICEHKYLFRAVGRRYYAGSPEILAKRNYAINESEYGTVIAGLIDQRRYFLARDVYDDMKLDGIQPTRDAFHGLIANTMKGRRLQDAFFFLDEMKANGFMPSVVLYNHLISICAKCNKSDQATLILEEMKHSGVKPNGETFICLLSAYATAGRLDRVNAIVRDMTAAGLGLNKFCYAGLITAHMNKTPHTEDIASKIIELVEQSKGWSSVEASKNNAENVLMGISEEELYGLPTAEYVNRRFGFLARQLTVYHVAFHALADLRNVEATKTLENMLRDNTMKPDIFIRMQIIRCYLHSGDIDGGYREFVDYMNSGSPPMIELYVTLIEGAMVGYTPRGMQLAQEKFTEMVSRNFSLSLKMGSDLLLAASGDKDGGYAVANMIWDSMRGRNLTPFLQAVEAYHKGLTARILPKDDTRLVSVSAILDDLRPRAKFLNGGH